VLNNLRAMIVHLSSVLLFLAMGLCTGQEVPSARRATSLSSRVTGQAPSSAPAELDEHFQINIQRDLHGGPQQVAVPFKPRRLQGLGLPPQACLPHACFSPATVIIDVVSPGNTSKVVSLTGQKPQSSFVLSTVRRPGLSVEETAGGLRFTAVSTELTPGLHNMRVWAFPMNSDTITNTTSQLLPAEIGAHAPPVVLAVQVLVRAPLLRLIPSGSLGTMVLPNGTATAGIDLYNDGLAPLFWNISAHDQTPSLAPSQAQAVFHFLKAQPVPNRGGEQPYLTGCDSNGDVTWCSAASWAAGALLPRQRSTLLLQVVARGAQPGVFQKQLQVWTNEGQHVPTSDPPSVFHVDVQQGPGRIRVLPWSIRVNNLWVCPTSLNTVLFPLGNYSSTISVFSIDALEQQRLELDTSSTANWLSVLGAPETLPLQATPVSISLFVIADAAQVAFPQGTGVYATSLQVLACPATVTTAGKRCQDAPPGTVQRQDVQVTVNVQQGTPSLSQSEVLYESGGGVVGGRVLQGGVNSPPLSLPANADMFAKVFLRDAWAQMTTRDLSQVQYQLFYKPTAEAPWQPVVSGAAVTPLSATQGGGAAQPSLLLGIRLSELRSSTGFVSLQVLYRGQPLRGGGLGQLVSLAPAACDARTQVRTADGLACLCKLGMQPVDAASGGGTSLLVDAAASAASAGPPALAGVINANKPCVACAAGFARNDAAAAAAAPMGSSASPAQPSLLVVPVSTDASSSLSIQAQLCSACRGTTFSHAGAATCLQCPARGALCSGGTVALKAGWWVPDSIRLEDIAPDTAIYPCINADACGVPSSAQSNGSGLATAAANSTAVSTLVLCSDGYEGPLCFACEAGWLKVFGVCVRCWSRAAAAAACVAVVCVSLLWPLCSALLAKAPPAQAEEGGWWGGARFTQGASQFAAAPSACCRLTPRSLIAPPSHPLSSVAAISDAAHFAAKDSLMVSVRLFWQWAQLFAVLSTALEVTVPSGAGRVLEALGAWGDVFGLDLLNWVCVWPRHVAEGGAGGSDAPPQTGEAPEDQGSDVFNSVFWSVFWGVGLPTAVLCVALLAARCKGLRVCAWRGGQRRTQNSAGSTAAAGSAAAPDCTGRAYTALAWVLLAFALGGTLLGTAYSTVTRTVFATFDTLSVQVQGETLLRSDVTLSTGDVQYTGAFATAVVFGVVFLAFWPVLLVRLSSVAYGPTGDVSPAQAAPWKRVLCCCMAESAARESRDKMVQHAQDGQEHTPTMGVFRYTAQAFVAWAAAGLHADGTHRGTLEAVQRAPETHIHSVPSEEEHVQVWKEDRLFHEASKLHLHSAGQAVVLRPACFEASSRPKSRYWWIALEYGRFLLVAGVGAFFSNANEQLLALCGWLLGYTLLLVAVEPYSTARANILGITGSIAQLLVVLGLHYLYTAARAVADASSSTDAVSGVAAGEGGRTHREQTSILILFVLVFAVVLLFAMSILVDTVRVLMGPGAFYRAAQGQPMCVSRLLRLYPDSTGAGTSASKPTGKLHLQPRKLQPASASASASASISANFPRKATSSRQKSHQAVTAPADSKMEPGSQGTHVLTAVSALDASLVRGSFTEPGAVVVASPLNLAEGKNGHA